MPSLPQRIMGVETEFGCLVRNPVLMQPTEAVELIKNAAFYDLRVGALDLHARDEVFEPARSGGFCRNGARLYIDNVGSHLEYATAECLSIKDVIANDRAGQRLILRAMDEAGLREEVAMFNNSVDHFGGHTFGCHENYLAAVDDEFFAHRLDFILGFLVTRQIFAGTGRVGGHVLSHDHRRPTFEEVTANPVDYIWVSSVYQVEPDPSVTFQLSQRADHILKVAASRVRFNRAMINPKWEHFYDHEQFKRLHLLFGEANQNEIAYGLKLGTTSLVLRLSEEGWLEDDRLRLTHPIRDLQQVSRNVGMRELVRGPELNPIDVQRTYLGLADQHYRGESDEIDWVLREWASILDGLENDPMSLGHKLDWVAKYTMIRDFIESEDLSWEDPICHSLDMEYHNIDPAQSLFYAIPDVERMTAEADIVRAMSTPPQDTRAKVRGGLVAKAMELRPSMGYAISWEGVALGHREYYDLSDPYATELIRPNE